MSGSRLQIFLAVLLVWSGAIVLKATFALRSGKPYTFSIWDGGALLSGKRLATPGTQRKLVLSALMIGLSAGWLTQMVPFHVGKYGIMSLAVVVGVTDLVSAKAP